MPEFLAYPAILLTTAATLLLLALAMKNMLPLRALAFCAALLFAAYAFSTGMALLVVAALALVLIAGFRLYEVQNTSRKIRRTRHYG